MSTHSKEPWTRFDRADGSSAPVPADKSVVRHWLNTPEVDRTELQRANVDRCVACVNALAGIPDPEKFVSAVRAAVAAGAVDEIYLTLIREAMG